MNPNSACQRNTHPPLSQRVSFFHDSGLVPVCFLPGWQTAVAGHDVSLQEEETTPPLRGSGAVLLQHQAE